MHIPRSIGRKIHRLHQKIHRQGALNAEPVALRWTDLVFPEGYLQDVETSPQPVATPRVLIVTALVHTVNIHTTGYTRYTQVRHGDVILDFLGDAPLDDKPHLRFEIGGVVANDDMTGGAIYVQKDGGDELAASWDVRCNGLPVTRTVLACLLS